MHTIDDGGAAFPRHCLETHYASDGDDHDRLELRSAHPGMSLRDYFAAKWLTTIVTHEPTDADEVARVCYVMADAMLRAREAKS